MMRLARRASLLVAFYLLASAATAYAEFAWLLWISEQDTISYTSTGEKTWNTPLVYPDRESCAAIIVKRVKSWKEARSPLQSVEAGAN